MKSQIIKDIRSVLEKYDPSNMSQHDVNDADDEMTKITEHYFNQGWSLTIHWGLVDSDALYALIFTTDPKTQRVEKPDLLWHPKSDIKNPTSDYDRAMKGVM